LFLDDLGILRGGDADAIGHPQHVPVDREPGDTQRVAEHDVRRLPADAGQLHERIHAGGHLPGMLVGQTVCHPD
jgi:hypothetical protein